jgi:hypothetical protein
MIAHVILAIFAARATVTLFTCILDCSASSQGPETVSGAIEMRDAGAGSMDEKPPHIAVSSLADPEKRCLPAGRVFSRHKAQPGCEVARPSELSAVADRGEQGRRGQRSDAGNGHQPARTIVPRGKALDLPGRLGDPLVDPHEVLEELRRIAGVRSLVSLASTRGRSRRKTPAPWRIAMPYSRQKART